jgi:hypothetical protein
MGLLFYSEDGETSEYRIVAVSNNLTKVEVSLISAGTINKTDIRGTKTISYLLEPDETISDGHCQGLIKSSGRAMASYTLKLSGEQKDDATLLDGFMLLKDQSGGELSYGISVHGKKT